MTSDSDRRPADPNPYASPRYISDEIGPVDQEEMLKELRWLGIYSRVAIRSSIAQLPLLAIWLIGVIYFQDAPLNWLTSILIGLFIIAGIVHSAIVFLLSRLAYPKSYSWVIGLVLGYVGFGLPVSFLSAILPLLQARRRLDEYGIEFG